MKTNNYVITAVVSLILLGCHKTQSPADDPLVNTYKMRGAYNMSGYYYPYTGYTNPIIFEDSIVVLSNDSLFVYSFYNHSTLWYNYFHSILSNEKNSTITFIADLNNDGHDTLSYNYATGRLRHARIDDFGWWYTNSQ